MMDEMIVIFAALMIVAYVYIGGRWLKKKLSKGQATHKPPREEVKTEETPAGATPPPSEVTPPQPAKPETVTFGNDVILTVPRDLKKLRIAHEMLRILEDEVRGTQPKPKKVGKRKK